MTGPEDDEAIDVVLTVGDLDPAVVALREFLHRASAIEVQALVDRGDDRSPAEIWCARLQPIEVIDDGRTVHLPHTAELDVPVPTLPEVPRLPPIEIDPGAASVSAPIGAIARLGDAVEALSTALGGRSVAIAYFQTTDDELPLGIAAREGEPVLLTLGEEQFHLPDA